MRRSRGVVSTDTDSLQADVMRFLAIIAFVLIAVLTLVENLAPVPVEPSAVEETLILDQVEAPEPEETGIQDRVDVLPPATTADPVAVESTPEAKVDQDAEPSLVLRFSSDKAFLFLLGQGEISLYGRRENGFRQLTPGFELIDTTLTGNLYEVMPASLPKVVRRVFAHTTDQGRGTETYLVALPAAIHQQIAELQAKHSGHSGTLTINRAGEVHYENA
jgi:hypothetical protein